MFLYERAAQILLYLVNCYTPKTISQIQSLVRVSNRTVRYDLDNIDDFLLINGIHELLRKPKIGISFVGDEEDRKKVKKILKNVNNENYIFSPDERIEIIVIEFIESQSYINTKYLAEELQVSQSTINKDIKEVKKIFKSNGIELVFRQRYGLKLKGKERNIRNVLVELWLKNVYNSSHVRSKGYNRGNNKQFKLKKLNNRLIKDIDIPFIENAVNIMEKRIGTNYSDVAYANIVVHICVALIRIKNQKYINFDIGAKGRLKKTIEFIVAKDMAEIFENYYDVKIKEDEILYISTCLLGGNLSSIRSKYKGEWIYVQLLVKEVIEQVNSKIIMDISQDWKLFNSLLVHIKPMMNRVKYGIKLENPILESIQKDYENLFQIVKDSVSPIEKFLGKKLNNHEIGYLTIHFGASIERERFSGIVKPKALIVCNTGLGTSELLLAQIQSMFEVHIAGAISKRKLEYTLKNEEIDIIISTVPIERELGIKVVNVNPILSRENIKQLNSIFLKSKEKKIEVDGLINVIEKSCIIKDIEQLEKDLYSILNMKLITNMDGVDKPVLRDIITKERIKLNVEVKDWEEAVRIGGRLLVDTGAVEPKYVDAMVDVVKEVGPYIVILDGIAMPHARPEDGVKEIGMSIVTLKSPIKFNNEENDPVKLVLSFCAVDSESHLKALSQLMVLLEDNNAIEKILTTNSVDEVVETIDRFS